MGLFFSGTLKLSDLDSKTFAVASSVTNPNYNIFHAQRPEDFHQLYRGEPEIAIESFFSFKF